MDFTWLVALLSGQFSIGAEKLCYLGQIGAELSEEQGYAAARLGALNVLAQTRAALGDFSRLTSLLRVEGHVASASASYNAPAAPNGASALFVSMLGERERHSGTAFTPERLPLNLGIELVESAVVRRA